MATTQGQLAGVQQGLSELRARLLFVLFALLVYSPWLFTPLVFKTGNLNTELKPHLKMRRKFKLKIFKT